MLSARRIQAKPTPVLDGTTTRGRVVLKHNLRFLRLERRPDRDSIGGNKVVLPLPLLDQLRVLDCARRTIVVLWSDHGWQLGEHHMFSKHSNYEVATNSPLIMKIPGMNQPGTPADGLVQAVDLFPTLTDLCGLPTPDGLAGQSIRAMVEDASAPGRDAAYSTHAGGRGYRGHSLRTGRYRLVRWIDQNGSVGLVEFYDHKKDPGENVNIARERADVVAQLTRQLSARIDQVVQTSHSE